ncbi:MAG: FAD-dependent oxidoreductase [Actinomycetia bacterium]|nr:FAD-dependent oxidoreductase [Actinomycetes bacterium]
MGGFGATDVVVAGGGMAGLCAAIAALEAGARVLLVEKGTRLGGSMALSGGIVWTFEDRRSLHAWIPDGDATLKDLV